VSEHTSVQQPRHDDRVDQRLVARQHEPHGPLASTRTAPRPLGDEMWLAVSGAGRRHAWLAQEDVPSSVELRWRPDLSGDVHEVILHEGSDSFANLALDGGA
jgi:hypothetical protein